MATLGGAATPTPGGGGPPVPTPGGEDPPSSVPTPPGETTGAGAETGPAETPGIGRTEAAVDTVCEVYVFIELNIDNVGSVEDDSICEVRTRCDFIYDTNASSKRPTLRSEHIYC